MQIDFDPRQTNYADLLDLFWKTHNPCAQRGSRQYMSAVFYHNDAQFQLIQQTSAREAARRGAPIATAVLPATSFTLAEDYHQKYMLRRRRDVLREFQAMYPNDLDFIASTAAARVNGFLGGYGPAELLDKEIASYGLSPAAQQALLDAHGRRR